MNPAKHELRTRLLASRRGLSRSELVDARAAVARHLLTGFARAEASSAPWNRVFAYEPMATEPGSIELLDALSDRGASIYLPVLRPDNDLDWVQRPDGAPLGPDVVATASVVLVPALAIDRTGLRIGRGGGSYDRILPRVGAGVEVIALLHRDEVLDEVPAEAWDCRVRAAVSPDGWFYVPTR